MSINPANAQETRVTEATRVPMSVPEPRLAVPEIEGWHLHWFLEKNIPRAEKAGYVFVEDDEVDIANRDLIADDAAMSGNTDLGSRISMLSGGDPGPNGQIERLVLMKIRQEWWEEDQKSLEARNDKIAEALRSGKVNQKGDVSHQYLKQGQNLFYPKTRKG